MSSVPNPMSMNPGSIFPYQFSSPTKGQCRNGCSNRCAPRCSAGCCRSLMSAQFKFPQSLDPAANFPQSQFALLGLQQSQAYPMTRRLGCGESCPGKCAPRCAIGCCRWFGGLYKKSKITRKHKVPGLDDE